jgi:hypothetical protein
MKMKEGNSNLGEKFAPLSAAIQLDNVDITVNSMIRPVREYEMTITKVLPLCPRKTSLEGQRRQVEWPTPKKNASHAIQPPGGPAPVKTLGRTVGCDKEAGDDDDAGQDRHG